MSRNGSGTYSLPVGNPVVTGTTISSTWANNTLTDIANALTGSLAADGQTTASGNLNMGTNKVINLGDPTNAQDACTKYYVDQLVGTLGTMAYQDANAVDITGGSVSNVALDLHAQTGEMYLPVGPTALRTASPTVGLMRFNTDGGGFYEGYNGTSWQKFTTINEGSYTITYLVIDGGGGGATNTGGGGGAGGFMTSSFSAIPATNFIITVGAGGASNTNGAYSSITGIVTGVGGGAGGSASYGGAAPGAAGSSGGGGGGGTGGTSGAAGGTGTSGIGNNGGAGSNDNGSSGGNAGGGGGAGAVGSNGVFNSAGGAGGVGRTSTITGATVYYAGGGGGGSGNAIPTGGTGGTGGGGNGGNNVSGGSSGTNGAVNTGGGGGGGGFGGAGANGGAGVVILSMPTVSYTGTTTGGPTVSVSGSNTIVKFTSSGSYTA